MMRAVGEGFLPQRASSYLFLSLSLFATQRTQTQRGIVRTRANFVSHELSRFPVKSFAYHELHGESFRYDRDYLTYC